MVTELSTRQGGGVGGLYNALVTCQYVLSSRWWWWWSAEKMLTRCLLLTLIVIRSNYVPCSIPHLICRRLSLLIAESSLWWYQTDQSALTNKHVTELGKESPGGFRNEEKAQVNGLALSRSHPGGDWNISDSVRPVGGAGRIVTSDWHWLGCCLSGNYS